MISFQEECPRRSSFPPHPSSCDEHDRLLLQSIIKPELGRLLLRQFSKNRMTKLIGGDEFWTEDQEPEVEVTLLRRATKSEDEPEKVRVRVCRCY